MSEKTTAQLMHEIADEHGVPQKSAMLNTALSRIREFALHGETECMLLSLHDYESEAPEEDWLGRQLEQRGFRVVLHPAIEERFVCW